MGDTIEFKPKVVEEPLLPNKEVVEKLIKLLADAHAGKITSLIYGIARPDGTISTGYNISHFDKFACLAAAAILQKRVVQELDG